LLLRGCLDSSRLWAVMPVVPTLGSIVSSYTTLVATVVLDSFVDLVLTDIWSFGISGISRRYGTSSERCGRGLFSTTLLGYGFVGCLMIPSREFL